MSRYSVYLFSLLLASACSQQKPLYDPSSMLPTAFKQNLVVGQTERSYLLSALGQPTKIQRSGERQVLYTYALENLSRTGRKRFYLVGKRTEQRRLDYFHVLMRDDVVVKHWIDDYVLVEPAALNARLGGQSFIPDTQETPPQATEK